jgi:YheC/D like ATP-grasp
MSRSLGILITNYVFNKINTHTTTYEYLPFYEEACNQYDLSPCFFRISDIDVNKKKINAYVKGKYDYSLEVMNKPSVIHNRVLLLNKTDQEKIKALQQGGLLIFNECTRYEKLKIHRILEENKIIRQHLPKTLQANRENFLWFIKNYRDLIIKPNNGTFGNEIIRISYESKDLWKLAFGNETHKFSINRKWPIALKMSILNRSNIIQQRMSLATYKGNPFDLRVSIQKNNPGNWQVSGIVAKVARKGDFVTNVATGGMCLPIQIIMKELPHLELNQVKKEIIWFSLAVADQLDTQIPNLADIGLDIGMTNEGFPMIIECNGRDLRITFREANLLDEWKATHTTPVGYVSYLLKKHK